MGSREKLALFNMITEKVKEATLLDAFAGSGALGIEALSRGAPKVVFVDKSREAIDIIKKNLASLGLKNECEVIKGSIHELVDSLGEFEIIIADPPYDNFDKTEVSELPKMLKRGGIFVLSHPGEVPDLPGLTLLKTHKYASAHISIYVKN